MEGFRRERLRERRLQSGSSQRDLAEKSGVGQDTISGIEAGHRDPRPSTLRKLAEALNVEVRDFFAEAAVATSEPKEGEVVGGPLAAPLSSPEGQQWLRGREREGR